VQRVFARTARISTVLLSRFVYDVPGWPILGAALSMRLQARYPWKHEKWCFEGQQPRDSSLPLRWSAA
jgi:hypothetical protein